MNPRTRYPPKFSTLAAATGNCAYGEFRFFLQMCGVRRIVLMLAVLLASATAWAADSQCFGSASKGSLENGVSLPLSGDNFSAYSFAGWSMGRTYVHSKVRAVLLQAYQQLEAAAAGKVFVYGETSAENGGPFAPHKTHQNGTSVDLMVPVLLDGESVPLPGGMFNRYGYDIEFDNTGKFEEYSIDFEALGELVYQLDQAARAQKVGISRVIFEVPLQKLLWRSARGEYLRKHVVFSTKAAWVRHDEHIHVDFVVPCGKR